MTALLVGTRRLGEAALAFTLARCLPAPWCRPPPPPSRRKTASGRRARHGDVQQGYRTAVVPGKLQAVIGLGEVAPLFALLNYRDVSKRAKLIRAVISERIMPPWKGEPGIGHFVDERRLTDDQIALITGWVDGGAVEGDPADLPATPQFTAGWEPPANRIWW